MEAESGAGGGGGRGEGGGGRLVADGVELLWVLMKCFQLDCGNGNITVYMLKTTELCTLRG